MPFIWSYQNFIADVIASRVAAGRAIGKDLAAHLPSGLTFTEFLERREICGFRDIFVITAEAYKAYVRASTP